MIYVFKNQDTLNQFYDLEQSKIIITNLDIENKTFDINVVAKYFNIVGYVTDYNLTYQCSVQKPIEYIIMPKAKNSLDNFFFLSSMTNLTDKNSIQSNYTDAIISKYHKNVIVYTTTTGDIIFMPDRTVTIEFDENIDSSLYTIINTFNTSEDESEDNHIIEIRDIISEEEYLRFKKYYHINVNLSNEFHSNMCSYDTPVGSYLDLESDFLMNFIKYLYEKKNKDLLDFLKDSEKYETILNMAITYGTDTTVNKEQETIENAFIKKREIQNNIVEYKNKIKQTEEATSEAEFPDYVRGYNRY